MEFIVETVTPECFHHNLLLGLPKLLDKLKKRGVMKKHLTRYEPASLHQIAEWESRNEVTLPDDLRRFYASSNGFLYQWVCSYGPSKLLVTGKISINSLNGLEQIMGYHVWSNPEIIAADSAHFLKLGFESKMFKLVHTDYDYTVCLVYLFPTSPPTIWLCTHAMQYYYLANSFTNYFRMSLAHMGFPHWQLIYTSMGLPEWVKVLMRMICPGILRMCKNKHSVKMVQNEREKMIRERSLVALNKLDSMVFSEHYVFKKKVIENMAKNDAVELFLLKAPPKKKNKGKSPRRSHKSGNSCSSRMFPRSKLR